MGRALGGLQRPSDNYIQPINDRQPAGWARAAGALGEHVRLTLTQTEISEHMEGKVEGVGVLGGGARGGYVLFANMQERTVSWAIKTALTNVFLVNSRVSLTAFSPLNP